MFGGPKGCGKTSLARIVACAVVCTDLQDGEPCGACDSCLGVKQESAESFEEFDAATQGSVEHMRSIVSDLDYGNLSGKPSIFILDEAQRLTKHAQDALLKSVEERRMLVILCTTEPHKIQGPLRDRLTEFPVSAPSAEVLLVALARVCVMEGIPVPSPEVLKLIIQAQDNCPRTCLTTLETLSGAGEITVDDVKTYFRFGAIEKLIGAMENLASDPRTSIGSISELLDTEGPSWVCEKAVLIITSAIRISVGAKPIIQVLGNTRGPGWLTIAKALGTLDKPSAADVEAVLLEAIPNLPASPAVAVREHHILPEVPISKPVEVKPVAPKPVEPAANRFAEAMEASKEVSKPASVPASKPVEPARKIVEPKSIEIDGVRFTKEEKLTSVDNKIEKGTRGAPTTQGATSAPDTRLDKDLLPMSPKEFTRGFFARIRNS